MVLRVLRGLSLQTIHTAFRYSEFELLQLNHGDNIAEVPEDKQRVAAMDHRVVEQQRRFVEQFASLRLGLTAVHPEPRSQQWPPPEGLNRETPRKNCLRRLFTGIFEDPQSLLEDCILLANRVQRHKCDKKYCLKPMPNAPRVASCKFHFPLQLEGFEAEMEAGRIVSVVNMLMEVAHLGARFCRKELRVMRNHPRMVDTIQEVMLGWRGNTNFRIVQSLEQLLEYVLKYMLKPTTGSSSFENTVKDIVMQQNPDSRPASVCQRVLMRQISEHDMPRTEAVRIVSGLPFVFYSREFRMVNLMGVRRLEIPEQQEHDDSV